jgi:hypothetical protein
MATKTANQASAGVQPKALRVGVASIVATYSLDASLSNGDVVQMLKVPVNARVIDLYLVYASNGQGSLRVGDGVDTDRYISDVATSSGLTATQRMNGLPAPYTYSADDTIDVVVSASAQASSGAIYLVATVEYPGP